MDSHTRTTGGETGTQGQRLGQYELVELLGRGGMASVFRAWQPSLDRWVAIKVLRADLAADPAFVQRFQNEARYQARLSHPYVVPIYEVGQAEGTYYIAMRYVPDGTLLELMRRSGPISMRRATLLLGQIADALDYAHAQGVVHRDLKPANVLLDPNDRVSLADFGIAQANDVATRLTRIGVVAGSAAYMSPEQAQPNQTVDYRTDLYALGVVAFELLAGRVPFSATTDVAILHQQIYEPPPSIRSLRADLPDGVDDALQIMLAKDPADRFDSAGAFVKALGSWSNGSQIGPGSGSTQPSSAPTVLHELPTQPSTANIPVAERLSRPALLIGALMGLAVVVAVVAAAAFAFSHRSGPELVSGVQVTAQPTPQVGAPGEPATAVPTLIPTQVPAPVVAPPTVVPATAVRTPVQPTATAQASATPIPAIPAVFGYTVSPQQVQPGNQITLSFDLGNSGSSPVTTVLGASIRRSGDSRWMDDPADDVTVRVLPGRGIFTRVFRVPVGLADGAYDVAWGIFSPSGENFDLKQELDVLRVVSPAPVVPTPRPAPPAPAPAAQSDPQTAVRDYYAALDRHDFNAAWALMSPRLQGSLNFQRWADGYAGTSNVQVPTAQTIASSGSSATVSFTVTSADSGVDQAYQGTWDLVLVGGTWRVDRSNIKQIQ